MSCYKSKTETTVKKTFRQSDRHFQIRNAFATYEGNLRWCGHHFIVRLHIRKKRHRPDWWTARLEELLAGRLSKNFLAFMEYKSSLQCLQKPLRRIYLVPNISPHLKVCS